GDARLDALDDLERVGLRLPQDPEPDHVLAVAAERGPVVGRPERDAADVAQTDEVAVAAAPDDEPPEVLGRLGAALDADGELAVRRLDTAGWQLDVLGAQRPLDVAGGDPGRRERLPVE